MAQKVKLSSIGRCGTTMLYHYLIRSINPRDISMNHSLPIKHWAGKCIFLFGDPRNSTVSAHKPMKSLVGHYNNLGGDFNKRERWYLEDTLKLERLFDAWYQPQPFSFISVRYETIWDNLDVLGKYLNIDFSNFPKKQERESDWRKHSRAKELEKTFAPLVNKMAKAEDIKIWT